MSNRIFNPELAIEKQVCNVYGNFDIGASGAVSNTVGVGITSVTKESAAGSYTIALQDAYDKLLGFNANLVSDATGGSGIGTVEINEVESTIQTTFKTKSFKIQLYAPAAATFASLVKNGVTLYSKIAGTAGNSITLAVTAGATAGSEVVTVTGTAISVQVESGVSTATQMVAALAASAEAMSIVSAVASTGATAQTAYTATALAGGTAATISAANAVSGTRVMFNVVARRSSVGPA